MSHILPHHNLNLDPAHLLSCKEIHFRVDEILSVYTELEQSALYALAQGNPCQAPQLCLDHGLIAVKNDTVFSMLI